jgi:hypothetical protein
MFRDYQASTNVFFPVRLPFFDHRRTPGWPLEASAGDAAGKKKA